jgi:ribonuclease PH
MEIHMVGGAPFLDLTYAEDSRAEVDMNVVATDKMRYIELQGTGEGNSFSEEEMNSMLSLARRGISTLIEKQREILGPIIAEVDAMAMTRLTKKFR